MLIQENDLPQELINSAESEIGTIHKPLEDQILESLRHLKFSRSSITQTAKNLGDRDRGTITEYFRGMCFEQLVEAEFNRERAAKNLAGTDDPEIINQVLIKMNNYLKNLKTYASSGADIDPSGTPFQGLPGKYHTFLLSILKNFDKLSE
jgi:hypothetical protein